jgi:hypothetical protein
VLAQSVNISFKRVICGASRMAFRPRSTTSDRSHRNDRPFPPNYLRERWLDLYWTTELDP